MCVHTLERGSSTFADVSISFIIIIHALFICEASLQKLLRPSPDVRPQKRRRSNRIPDEDADEEVILSSPVTAKEEVTSVYTAQLVVYDQHLHRLLTDGDYEVVLQEVSDQVTSCGRSRASWETISGHCVSMLVRNRYIVRGVFPSL